jgi:hypothetical protein
MGIIFLGLFVFVFIAVITIRSLNKAGSPRPVNARMQREIDRINREAMERRDQKRQERFGKDWTFKRIFYEKVDEILNCQNLRELQPGIEFLLYFSEQIDGKTIYQPLSGFNVFELQNFLYGLLNWDAIKNLIIEHGEIKQVDIISQLGMDKDKTGFFLYMLDKMGVLAKQKQGRYNTYTFVTEQLTKARLKNSWGLFDESKRLPTE